MIKSKHDLFVSKSLEHPAIAKDFIKYHIPSYLKAHIMWKDLYRIDRTNTDAALKRVHQDIVYKATTNRKIDVIINIEHQSKGDATMSTRILRYNLHILEAHIKQGCNTWPLLISILLYNGLQTPYPYPSETSAYYGHSHWGKKELYSRFHLIDLTQISDLEILTHGICAPLEILIKHSLRGSFELDVSAYRPIFQSCIRAIGDDYIISMLTYADSLKDFKIGRKMHNFVEEIFEDKKELIMTYGQLLKRAAKREGRQEGRQEGMKIIAKNMLKKRYSIKSIQEITELPKEIIEKLKEENNF
jgi:predicted transposase YdaD